jgi:anti-sigma regulatory factor (Ser/Thr protein kinase)
MTDFHGARRAGALRHAALLYRNQAERRAQILSFVRTGLETGEPLLVAMPDGETALPGGQLDGVAGELAYADMADVGRNPARIIPALQAFVDRHAGGRVRALLEPVWPDRSPAEIREAIRHEALVNLALAGSQATVLCLYDVTRLAPFVIADAQRTHPRYLLDGRQSDAAWQAPWQVPPEADLPLPPPPASAEALAYDTDLVPLRRLVESHARWAALSAHRVADLVLAVSEIAANTLGHTRSGGVLHVWHDQAEILCQTDDRGWITDPLAGRVRHGPEGRGHGLYVVNHVCDLVEVRTGEAGTTVRMHMRLRPL